MLKTSSLSGAKLIAGENGILNEISGVNVLEAIDIENWGRSGEVILTSFFALQNLSENELEIFFEKLHRIGISAIIIKIERLVHKIPNKIVELSNKHLIPLIQIGKDIKYESIILGILGPIINRNVYLLNKYYKAHSELTNLALKMPSMEEILHEFKKMILRDVSLINCIKGTEISTNPKLSDITLRNKGQVQKEEYMYFNYERNEVVYNSTNPKLVAMQIRVHIPCPGFADYELIIHEMQDPLNSEDFMVIENAVKFLQMELLKKYVVSQNLFQQKNNLIGDLLNGRLYEEKDTDEVLESLDINKHKYYQIAMVKLYQHDSKKNQDQDMIVPILRKIRNSFKINFKDIAFLEKTDRIVFIINFKENQKGFDSCSIEKAMLPLTESNLFNGFYYCISISSWVEKSGIPGANKEVLDTQKVLRLFHNSNTIMPYEELGIYKLFLESNSLDELEKFVSPRINRFRLENPQLFETLGVFLDTNQSYLLTAEKLFLHPKTVRYRIDKIKDLLSTEFTNPEEILQIQVASRLFKLIEGVK